MIAGREGVARDPLVAAHKLHARCHMGRELDHDGKRPLRCIGCIGARWGWVESEAHDARR